MQPENIAPSDQPGHATQAVAQALRAAQAPDAAGVFILLTPVRARRGAIAADRRAGWGKALGPLDGAIIVWKDLFDQCGEVTTAGSATRIAAPPANRDADAVHRLEAAGLVSLGRTNLSEFAFSGLGVNPHFGTPRNVFSGSEPLVPGGSSSGSAVAVALGIARVGMGTDTSGSLRVPAALNGVIGFRPSSARYCQDGVFPLAKSLDSIGPIARNLDDITAVDAILADRNGAISAKLEVLDLSEQLTPDCDPDILRAYQSQLRTYRERGALVRPARIKAIEDMRALFRVRGTLVAIEARRLHSDLLGSPQAQSVDPMILRRLENTPEVNDAAYAEYLGIRDTLIAQFSAETDGAILAHPTVDIPPPRLSALADPGCAAQLNARVLSATMPASFMDCPALALPIPAAPYPHASIQLSTIRGTDIALLSAAKHLHPNLCGATGAPNL